MTAAGASRTGSRSTIATPSTSSACIDIAPTLDMYAATDMAFARAYYHWFHLIQPSPLPEKMIGGNARDYLHAKLGGWGAGGLAHIEPQALAEYERCFCTAAAIHARLRGLPRRGRHRPRTRPRLARRRRVDRLRVLVLWGERGIVQRLFDPLALWRAQAAGRVDGAALPAGHFIPEELPDETAARLAAFFG